MANLCALEETGVFENQEFSEALSRAAQWARQSPQTPEEVAKGIQWEREARDQLATQYLQKQKS